MLKYDNSLQYFISVRNKIVMATENKKNFFKITTTATAGTITLYRVK